MLATIQDERGKPCKDAGKIDYVAAWYWKAAEYCRSADGSSANAPDAGGAARAPARCAFVSTNSITQGEQVAPVFRPLVKRHGFTIDFAHRTFVWNSDSDNKAHVHCVIVGFSCRSADGSSAPASDAGEPPALRQLFDADRVTLVSHINGHLNPGPDVWFETPKTPLSNAPKMVTGNRPADGGALITEDEDLAPLLDRCPEARKFIKRLAGSSEFIGGKKRWCLWLVGASPQELLTMPAVMERVRKCRENRLAAPDPGRRKLADTPTLFRETINPATCVAIPEVSSEARRYIPIAFLGPDTITTNKIKIVPDATLYHFGVLTSNVHMAWMRAVCGRLKSDYSYSNNLVYNNFPWPGAETQPETPVHLCIPAPLRLRIEQTAQGILDARAAHPESSFAALYNELTMPPDLRKAHQDNDRAVMAAYGFRVGMTESECVAELFKRYRALVEEKGR